MIFVFAHVDVACLQVLAQWCAQGAPSCRLSPVILHCLRMVCGTWVLCLTEVWTQWCVWMGPSGWLPSVNIFVCTSCCASCDIDNLLGGDKSEIVSNISSDAGSHSEATKVVGAEIGRSDSQWSGDQDTLGVPMQIKGGAGVNLSQSFSCVASRCW